MRHHQEPYHILRLTPHFYWPHLAEKGWPVKFDTIGGMQTQIYRQTLALARLGLKQTVMTLKVPGTDAHWSPAEGVYVRGVRVPIAPIKSRIRGMVDLNASWFLGVVAELVRRKPKFDLIHAHCSGVFWPLTLAHLASKWLDIPMVLTIHCALNSTYHPMSRLDEVLFPFSRFVERLAMSGAARTIVLTPRTLSAYERLGLTRRGKFAVVPDCIDPDSFRKYGSEERKRAFAQRFGIPDDVLCVTNLGRIAHEKGWRNLISLARKLSDAKIWFLVCGDGNERGALEAEVANAGLRDRFVITGYLSLEEVPAALARTDVLVLPSIHEEFGGVLLEAMAMEKPVVAFKVGGIPTVVEDGAIGWLVPPGDVGAMARAVREILSDPALARRMGTRGVEHVRQRFSLEAACLKLCDIYQEIIESYESARDTAGNSGGRTRPPRDVAQMARGERPSEFIE